MLYAGEARQVWPYLARKHKHCIDSHGGHGCEVYTEDVIECLMQCGLLRRRAMSTTELFDRFGFFLAQGRQVGERFADGLVAVGDLAG